MSKQLIYAFKSHVVIAALNNQAFAIVSDEKDANSVAHFLVELSPPEVTSLAMPSKKKSKSNEEAENEKITKPSSSSDKVNDEIQAVCCTVIKSHIWLAVSRADKTLSLYYVPEAIIDAEKKDAVILKPLAIYNMPKRARCLVFSTVQSNEDCNVIIAGDLSGDSYAYAVPGNNPGEESTATTAKASLRRLLLGHTASILTGMQITPSSSVGKKFILTADRDEKVRVSLFPETYSIHGYLLGHTAFISAMSAVSDDSNGTKSLCLTGSGDGTVRLFDYQTCKEVGMVPVMLQQFREDSSAESKENNYSDEQSKSIHEANEDESVEFDECDDDFEEEYDGLIAAPSSVAISSDATFIVVSRDGIPSIDIHPIPTAAKKTSSSSSLVLSQLISLHKKQTLPCPSQPLGVCILSDISVLVLVREPEFMLHFRCIDSTLEFKDVTSTSPFCSTLGLGVVSRNITMPIAALEYNEDGTLKLQKKVDNREFDNEGDEAEFDAENKTGKVGQHWNDKERRNTHRLANGRRRKRKLKESEKKEV